ncbi:hypothetical protein JB92DRAFT_3132382 [Gautieria morchelliformis]|nr:hypothetical protein JB92DRAFT_3132382 [Gautieria morchelliformis]
MMRYNGIADHTSYIICTGLLPSSSHPPPAALLLPHAPDPQPASPASSTTPHCTFPPPPILCLTDDATPLRPLRPLYHPPPHIPRQRRLHPAHATCSRAPARPPSRPRRRLRVVSAALPHEGESLHAAFLRAVSPNSDSAVAVVGHQTRLPVIPTPGVLPAPPPAQHVDYDQVLNVLTRLPFRNNISDISE